MSFLGSAAMLLSFDVAPEAVEEHDRWHTHEHLPERLSIPGFLRGTRWVATGSSPRYMVVYEVAGLSTLSSDAYLARLNAPTPWTQRMMPHYVGMRRGLCAVACSVGFGQGGEAALIRFSPGAPGDESLQQWLAEEALPAMAQRAGIGSAHLLRGAQAAAMTNEQRIRGADAGVDHAVIVTGYDAAAIAACANDLRDALSGRAAHDIADSLFRMSYSLSSAEVQTDCGSSPR